MKTISVLLSLAANFDWSLQQFDVKNTFLHGDVEEEIYIEVPPGFDMNFEGKKGMQAEKVLYSLKQSPRAWFGGVTTLLSTWVI